MQQTKAQVLHQKIDGLAEGMAKKLVEIYSELANSRYVLSVLAEQNLDSMKEINEEDVLDNIREYYLVTDKVAIHVPTSAFVKFNLITRKYELQPVTEEGKFTFKYQGIVTDENQDHTISAVNEQHAWQLLREILINNAKNK